VLLCFFVLYMVSAVVSVGMGTSVSGISSGGFFAVQYQVSFSSEVVGAAIFAGGPYYCAQDEVSYALTLCMMFPEGIDLSVLEGDAKGFASNGAIDALSNLTSHKVFLFSGTNDNTVNPGVVRKLATMYSDFGVTTITTNFNTGAGHSFPTNNYGNPCGTTQSPYITNCNYDGAEAALQTIYGTLKPYVSPKQRNIKKMNINKFVPSGNAGSISLDSTMYYYQPTFCRVGNCTVHVAFAGCQMTYSDIQLDFVIDSGYNRWAEANNMFILYPFTIKSNLFPENPEGCWDWWGFDDSNYAVKAGDQITTIHNIVKYFEGSSTAHLQ